MVTSTCTFDSTPHLRHKLYYLTCEEWADLLANAAGECQICARAVRLVVDHDHTIGYRAVRGMICHRCNTRLLKVDTGVREATPEEAAYLASPWHARASA